MLYRWDLRCLFEKLIDDREELDWFLANVVTPEWHFEHDAGRPLDDMVPERIAQFPQYESHIRAYTTRFVETIPGPVPGSLEIVRALAERGVPLFGITNFGAEFWPQFRAVAPIFDLFNDIIISGYEKLAKPDRAIYELALDRFGRSGERCLFIDDRDENVAGAEQLGIAGHLFRGAPALKNRLHSLELL